MLKWLSQIINGKTNTPEHADLVVAVRPDGMRDGDGSEALGNTNGHRIVDNRSGDRSVHADRPTDQPIGPRAEPDTEPDRDDSSKKRVDEMPPHKYYTPPPAAPKSQENAMSLFSTIDKDAKSIASKVEAGLKKLFLVEPKVEQVAVATISAVAPIVVAIAAVTGNEAEAAAIASIVSIVKTDLASIQVTLNEAGAGTVNISVKSTFAAINDNLAILLTAGYIKNPQTLATVTADVNKIETALNVLIAAL